MAVWRERLLGVRHGVEAAGLDWSAVPVLERPGNSRADGLAAGLALLSGADGVPAPTAVLVATDALAFGVLQAARDLGLRVPHDVSVVGFDDVDEAASTTPALTTVAQDLFAQGQDVARLAAGLAAGGDLHRTHPTELVVRGSTAPPPGGPS